MPDPIRFALAPDDPSGAVPPGAEPAAWVSLYRPDCPDGCGVVICPGGGYVTRMMEPEGHGIARWLATHGITGLVLEYRLPCLRAGLPFQDGWAAIRMARSRASEWELDPARIGIAGFSAGGHLAAIVATRFDAGERTGGVEGPGSVGRPDFALLVYPVLTMGPGGHEGSRMALFGTDPAPEQIREFSAELQVRSSTPPCFLAHAADDQVVLPDQTRDFYRALCGQGIPAEYLELPYGGHGLSGYRGPCWEAWQREALRWMMERGFHRPRPPH